MVCSQSVEVVERWSKRIAERVTPEEIDFATAAGVAYAAGGRTRKNLLARPSVQPGAFGPGIYAVELPLILRALADAGKALLSLLGSPYLSNALATGSLIVALRAGHGPEHAPQAEGPPSSWLPGLPWRLSGSGCGLPPGRALVGQAPPVPLTRKQ
jgi:hypothetical protein